MGDPKGGRGQTHRAVGGTRAKGGNFGAAGGGRRDPLGSLGQSCFFFVFF